MKRGLLCGASAVAVIFFTNILASSAQAAAPAAAEPAAAGEPSMVGEVVVTAEKRSQLLERVPVAITAFTAKMRDLEGIASVQDLTDFTPGLSYTTFDNRPYIRGIGRNTRRRLRSFAGCFRTCSTCRNAGGIILTPPRTGAAT